MKPSRRNFLLGTILVAALFCGVLVQGRHIAVLRGEVLARRAVSVSSPTAPPQEAPALNGTPLSEDEHLRLLSLRRDVAQLRREKSGLATLRAENQRLQTAVAQAVKPGAGPASNPFIAASKAQFTGYATPADTLQSFVWSLRNHDTNVLAQVLLPDDATKLWGTIGADGADKFFENAGAFPGFRIRSMTEQPDGTAEADLQMDPTSEDSGIKFSFQKIGGTWRLKLP